VEVEASLDLRSRGDNPVAVSHVFKYSILSMMSVSDLMTRI